MTVSSVAIQGYRGFAINQTLNPAIPSGARGSGLTLLVGANNTGKSTVVEAIRLFSAGQAPPFTEGRRNKTAGDRVLLRLETATAQVVEIRTVAGGGAESEFVRIAGVEGPNVSILGLPSRRHFSPFGGLGGEIGREQFSSHTSTIPRGDRLDAFFYRLRAAQRNRKRFDAMLGKVLDKVPDWTIEMSDQGNYYIKVAAGNNFHNSEGLGEGLVSLFFIVDSLYDSKDGDTVVIDEPELSLHPSLQRNLANLICETAATRQIICATHSPYFITADALRGGAKIVRVFLREHSSALAHLSQQTAQQLLALAGDLNNPHVFGLDAKEVFFLPDAVILVEGQEDVISYQKISQLLTLPFRGSFFGWGVGGAEKMPTIAQVLHELGFSRVVGILDGNKQEVATTLRERFPNYRFVAIPTDDVRTKPAATARSAKSGVLDENGDIRPQHRGAMRQLVTEVNAALK